MTTPTNIHAARKARGLTGEQLAAQLGISVGWLRTIERAPGLASPALLGRLATALGLAPTTLVRLAARRHSTAF